MRIAHFRGKTHWDREVFGAEGLEWPISDGAPEPMCFGGVRGADEEARATLIRRRNGIGTGHRNRLSVRSATDWQTTETAGGFRPPEGGRHDSASVVDPAHRSGFVHLNETCRAAAPPVALAN